MAIVFQAGLTISRKTAATIYSGRSAGGGESMPQKRGAGALLPSGGGRKRRLPSLLIGIAITTRDEGTKSVMNVCDPPVGGGNVEDTPRAHSDLAQVDTCFSATR